MIPSSEEGAAGRPIRQIEFRLGHKDAALVRSHCEGMEVQINDAPRDNERLSAVRGVTDSAARPGSTRLTVAGKFKARTVFVISSTVERGGAEIIFWQWFCDRGRGMAWRRMPCAARDQDRRDNSYSLLQARHEPNAKGWQLAVRAGQCGSASTAKSS